MKLNYKDELMLIIVCTYVKKNMAESDCGVACHRKINKVGRNTLGCLTASHN
jgi:hypothetical protein